MPVVDVRRGESYATQADNYTLGAGGCRARMLGCIWRDLGFALHGLCSKPPRDSGLKTSKNRCLEVFRGVSLDAFASRNPPGRDPPIPDIPPVLHAANMSALLSALSNRRFARRPARPTWRGGWDFCDLCHKIRHLNRPFTVVGVTFATLRRWQSSAPPPHHLAPDRRVGVDVGLRRAHRHLLDARVAKAERGDRLAECFLEVEMPLGDQRLHA